MKLHAAQLQALKSEGQRSPRREQGRRRPRNNDLRLLPARSCISSMDPEYLQGLREAKALLDEGIFSKEVGFSLGLPCECHTRLRSQNLNVRHWQCAKCTSSAELRLCACFRVILQARLISACAQDFEREKEKLTAERDARSQSSKVAASAVAAPSGNGSGSLAAQLLTNGSTAAHLLSGGSAAASLLESVASGDSSAVPRTAAIPSKSPEPSEVRSTAAPITAAAAAPATRSQMPVDRSGPVPSASELIAALNSMSLSRNPTSAMRPFWTRWNSSCW